MAKKKYYAVKKGKTPGIYLTWEDCKAQTEGFSGAIYKSFPTLEQAEQYVEGESSWDDDSQREEKTKAVAEEKERQETLKKTLEEFQKKAKEKKKQ